MNKSSILITIISIIAVFAFLTGAYYLTSQPQEDKVYTEVNQIQKEDYTKWAKKGKATLVEYSDLQCPACRSMHELIKNQIENDPKYKTVLDNVTFVYRHFPLAQHTYALDAAVAAEAAGKQNKFYDMVDLMFSNQEKWQDDPKAKEVFEGYAKQLKLDLEKFRRDRDAGATKDHVINQQMSGQRANVQATPTFYLNGKPMEFANFEMFRQQLAQAVK